jgi:hypothetical protein
MVTNSDVVIQDRVPEAETPKPGDRQKTETPYGYYSLLIAIFNGLFGAFLLAYRRRRNSLPEVRPFDLALLSMATLRLSKLLSEDEVTAVIRRPLIEVEGQERHPRGHGLRYAVGKLILCPTCTGTWVAALLTYALHLAPRPTRPLLTLLAASGLEQASDALLSLVYTDRDVLRREERNPIRGQRG